MKLSILLITVFSQLFLGIQSGSINPEFLSTFAKNEKNRDIIMEFSPVLDNVLSHPSLVSLDGDKRRSKIVELLKLQTSTIQSPVLKGLESIGFKENVKSFWISNTISIKNVPLDSIHLISSIPGTFAIREAETVTAFPVAHGPVIQSQRDKREAKLQWGVERVGAQAAYNAKITGAGVVVGVIDTGVNGLHEALKDNFNGSWKDVVNQRSPPYDDNGHGTHCTGTAVGRTNGIGVAPGATWIACKALDNEGSGSEEKLIDCGQFMACPNHSTGVCTGFANVVSCSWGRSRDNTFYNPVIEAWREMNIVPVFAIGNAGLNSVGMQQCGSANSPGDQPDLISVGSIDYSDLISNFSSRGCAGDVLLERPIRSGPKKPEVVAPGRDILSADAGSTTGYLNLSGTSMATPHVAGVVALLLEQKPDLKFEQVRDILTLNAIQVDSKTCEPLSIIGGGTPGRQNNVYGFGRISVPKALGIPST